MKLIVYLEVLKFYLPSMRPGTFEIQDSSDTVALIFCDCKTHSSMFTSPLSGVFSIFLIVSDASIVPVAIKSNSLKHKRNSSLLSRRVFDVCSLADLAALVYCTTRRNPAIYDGYGCWCGFGGSSQPVDGIDAYCNAACIVPSVVQYH